MKVMKNAKKSMKKMKNADEENFRENGESENDASKSESEKWHPIYSKGY